MRKCLKRSKALTLVETILALALTGLVLGLVGPLVLQGAQARHVAQYHASRHRQPDSLDHLIIEDFSRELPGEWISIVPLTVVEGSTLLIELVVLANHSPQPESLHTPRFPSLVRYWIKKANGDGLAMERELINLTDPGKAALRETVARGLESIDLEIRRRGQWSSVSSATSADLRDVDALRLSIVWKDGQTLSRTLALLHEK